MTKIPHTGLEEVYHQRSMSLIKFAFPIAFTWQHQYKAFLETNKTKNKKKANQNKTLTHWLCQLDKSSDPLNQKKKRENNELVYLISAISVTRIFGEFWLIFKRALIQTTFVTKFYCYLSNYIFMFFNLCTMYFFSYI